MKMAVLSTDEQVALATYEKIIHEGRESVGNALMAIRDNRLYRLDYPTFESYCKERWGMTKTHANRIIGSEKIAGVLAPIGAKPNLEQTRPLTKLRKPDGTPDEEKQRKAWEEAKAIAKEVKKKVTAKHVQKAVERINGLGKENDHSNLEMTPASHALWYAETAITHLKRIEQDDPKKSEAGATVIKWCKKNLL